MTELSDFNKMLKDNFPHHLDLMNLVTALRPQLENTGAKVYLSPDHGLLTVSKGETHVCVKINEGEQQRVGQWPFAFMRFIPDQEDPQGYNPSLSIDSKYPPVLKSSEEVRAELTKLFLGESAGH